MRPDRVQPRGCQPDEQGDAELVRGWWFQISELRCADMCQLSLSPYVFCRWTSRETLDARSLARVKSRASSPVLPSPLVANTGTTVLCPEPTARACPAEGTTQQISAARCGAKARDMIQRKARTALQTSAPRGPAAHLADIGSAAQKCCGSSRARNARSGSSIPTKESVPCNTP